jgi:hypothetical protein
MQVGFPIPLPLLKKRWKRFFLKKAVIMLPQLNNETRAVMTATKVPINFKQGAISMWRTSGLPWAQSDPFIEDCIKQFFNSQFQLLPQSIEVIGNNDFTVINVQFTLDDQFLNRTIITFNYGSVNIAGRQCSLQRQHELKSTDREHIFIDEVVQPPIQLNSITLVYQCAGDPPKFQTSMFQFHVNAFIATTFQSVMTHHFIERFLDISTRIVTKAIHIYFTQTFSTAADVTRFIFNKFSKSGSIATVVIGGHTFSVQPTSMALYQGTWVDRFQRDEEIQQDQFQQLPPGRRGSPPRRGGTSPRRAPSPRRFNHRGSPPRRY